MLSKGLFIKTKDKNILLKAQVHILTISRTVYERVKCRVYPICACYVHGLYSVCYVYGKKCLGFVMSSVCLYRLGYGTKIQHECCVGEQDEESLYKHNYNANKKRVPEYLLNWISEKHMLCGK